MDRILALTVFCKVVEKGSFVRAAEELDLAPATVTENVQALEKHLKTRLLNRTTRRIALTDEGMAYLEQARQILEAIETADGMLASRRASPKGTLRVMMPALLGTQVIIPTMPQFLARHPDLRIEFTLSAAPPDFVNQNLDLCLQITLDPDPGLIFRPLGLVRIVTAASPTYLKRRGRPRTLGDLREHDIIGVRGSGVFLNAMRFQIDNRVVSIEPESRLIADSGEAQRAAALAHGGIMQGAHYAVQDLLDAGKLARILEKFEWTGPPMGAVYPPNRFVSPKVKVFLDHAKDLLKSRISPYREDWDNR